MKKIDVVSRDIIAQLFSTSINRVVRNHASRITQEPQTTSKIAQSVEDHCNGVTVHNWDISAYFQDLPDRGPGAMEKKIGADLYIAVEIKTPDYVIRKGLLIQSKISRNKKASDQDIKQLENLNLSGGASSSFLWLYDETGVSVIPAQEVILNVDTKLEEFNSKNMTEHFQDILDCFSGSPDLCPKWMVNSNGNIDHEGLTLYLKEFALKKGLLVSIKEK